MNCALLEFQGFHLITMAARDNQIRTWLTFRTQKHIYDRHDLAQTYAGELS